MEKQALDFLGANEKKGSALSELIPEGYFGNPLTRREQEASSLICGSLMGRVPRHSQTILSHSIHDGLNKRRFDSDAAMTAVF